MKNAIIFYGGWDGHEPEKIASRFKKTLEEHNYQVTITDTLETLEDAELVHSQDLIVPVWTMGEISDDQVKNVMEAVQNGTGIAGCHGGMCDAFRQSVNWQFMTGGNWVSHPGGDGVEYKVSICTSSSPITRGIPDFTVKSEQYYLHVDPAVEVLAVTRFPHPDNTWFHCANGPVDMPVVWTKGWGTGRVFYNALGHHDDVFDIPEAMTLMERGLLWAGEGKRWAAENKTDASMHESNKKMF